MPLLTIATYNIHGGVGTDGRFDAGRIVGVIRELGAQVIALQEVRHRQVQGRDLLDHLAEATGLDAIAGPTLLRGDHAYGNALLTSLPVHSIRRHDISFKGREPRGAIDVDLAHEGIRLRIVATHLGLRPIERRFQVRRLLGLFGESEADMDILMGDLNEWLLWGRPLRWLHSHFQKTPTPATFPAGMPLLALDRIWVEPAAGLRTLGVHRTPLSRIASDHLPLSATLSLG